MSVMVIDYGAISDVTSVATRLADIFESKKENFEHIVSGLKSIPTSRNNLENANSCINNKNIQYQSKIDKLNLFGTKMSQFSQKAQETDQRVASRITTDSKVFEKKHKINVSRLAVIIDAVKTDSSSILSTIVSNSVIGRLTGFKGWTEKDVRGFKDGIKDWYRNGGKYKIEEWKAAFFTVVAITALIAGGSVLAVVAAAVIAFNAASKLYSSVKAENAYKSDGNRAVADRIGKEGGHEVAEDMGGFVGKETGNEGLRIWGEEVAGYVHGGLTLYASVYSIYKIGSGLKEFSVGKDFKLNTFYNDLKANGSSGNLTAGQVFMNNVKGKSVFKDIKNYGTVSTLMGKGGKISIVKEVIKQNYFDGFAKSSTISRVNAVVDFHKLVKNNTFNLVNKFNKNIDGITSSFKEVIDSGMQPKNSMP